ncbi:hypothetical protein FRACYDRAFT_259610 [Fragilariopsis cylindrus CCMP1102]|uniref:EGF-like domain-containing protein n=1 Tax=Fragilariopsis cylindrus CCMP1102 TaxID=635003 RepID=A0A1E7FR42_9STRA|nr:hypothetical protein FRACYDRAFT_259610 [Fragilariopsis cylindrus CCMP1102]|eukprot:OEU20618.1 hypothetical protein FRACYDRAFT_259610 [Fragilariopsis cylindrus CCMP1102]
MLLSNACFTTFLFLTLVVVPSAVAINSSGVAVLAQTQSNKSKSTTCDLDCPSFAPCVFGYADFSERKVDVVATQQQLGGRGGGTHQSGMHCDCPIGWTGLFCDIKYDSCTSNNQAHHECYNGAECMIGLLEDQYGNEQLFCDCNSINGYVGKYCETPIRDDDPFNPIVQDDDDNDPFIISQQNDDNDPFIPKDENDDDDSDPFIPKGQDDDDNDPFKQDSSSKTTTIPCGDGHCLNGGSCLIVQKISKDGTYKMNESCNCDGAYDVTSNSVFRGPYCQYKSTSLCFSSSSSSNNGEESSLFGNEDYCLHHGICKAKGDKLQQGCDCNSGWTGRNCQLKILELIDGIDDDDIDVDGDGDDNDPIDNWIAASDDDNDPIDNWIAASDDDNDPIDNWIAASDDDNDPIDNWIASSSSDVCGDTHCYNNGSCVQTQKLDSDGIPSLSFSCDCSTAYDEKYLYAGTSCEFPSTDLCLEGGDGSNFCVNHGSCGDDVLLGCNCPPGFHGFKCEFEEKHGNFDKDDNDNDGHDDAFDKEWVPCGDDRCHNLGKCITTVVYNEDIDSTETTSTCDCTGTDYFGLQCQYSATNFEYDNNKEGDEDNNGEEREACGDDLVCNNFGNCITSIKINKETDTTEASFRCDCVKTGFMGPQCQYPTSTSNINDEDNNEDPPTSNDGSEFFDCRLNCLNGGKCTQGEEDSGFLRDVLGDDKTHAGDHLAYCECKEGWIGLTCEYRVEICEDKHVCLHGSKCVGNFIDGYSCACDEADWKNDKASAFAGDSCQYTATGTDICTIGEEYPGKPLYFCVNSGICHAFVSGDQPNPGCVCPEGWMGIHCEIRTDRLETIGDKDSVPVGSIIGISSALIVFLVLVLVGIRLWITKKEKPEPTAVGKDISSKVNPFRRRRRRRGTNLVPNQRKRSGSPIANMSGNDGIMNHHHDLEQEGKPEFDELDDFIDNPCDNKSQIQSEELV